MKRVKFEEKVKKYSDSGRAKIALCIVGIAAAYALTLIPDSENAFWASILDFVRDKVSVSVFIGVAFAVFASKIATIRERRTEESLKTEADQQKIIHKYKNHKVKTDYDGGNFFDYDGVFMTLHSLAKEGAEKDLTPQSGDVYSAEYENEKRDIDRFLNGDNNSSKPYLVIASLNVYANRAFNTKLTIADNVNEAFKLPDFIIQNSRALLDAHKHSKKTNTATIRLDDFEQVDASTIKIHTKRTMYYHMLLTNRCMDYKLTDGMTLRDIYECNESISPINKSELGNQIGINGLVITKDGYLLIERRGLDKTTWKDKFAQPISLALKEKDLFYRDEKPEEITDATVEDRFCKVVRDTLKNNFGLREGEDYDELRFSENFMGFARDLLEGGKPNFYFYVVVNYTAREFTEKLQKYAALTIWQANEINKTLPEGNKIKPLRTEKLQNVYYLVPWSQAKVNFYYEMNLEEGGGTLVPKRQFAPRFAESKDNPEAVCSLQKSVKKQCGQALLACLSYAEILNLKEKLNF